MRKTANLTIIFNIIASAFWLALETIRDQKVSNPDKIIGKLILKNKTNPLCIHLT